MAIDETLSVLDTALKDGLIKLDPYLKQVRYACQTQFEKRLLGIQIQAVQKQAASSSAMHGFGGYGGSVMLPQGDSWRSTAVMSNPMGGRM